MGHVCDWSSDCRVLTLWDYSRLCQLPAFQCILGQPTITDVYHEADHCHAILQRPEHCDRCSSSVDTATGTVQAER